MRIGVDIGVDIGSHEACCVEGRGERVVCAREKVWQGSRGGHGLAHSGKRSITATPLFRPPPEALRGQIHM